jgi:decaprenyl-phosphate phosphoribosyltransferase
MPRSYAEASIESRAGVATALPTTGDEVPRGKALAVAVAMRPRQWVKNVLVFAAPGAAGELSNAHVAGMALVAAVAFCVAASGVYLLNDAIDVEVDRLHPGKQSRPVARGELSVPLASSLGIALLAIGSVGGGLVAGWQLSVVVSIYAAVNIAYCLWSKNEPVVDLLSVASGFVLRAIAGGVATHVALSNWFLIVTSFGSLFMVAGKRHAEHLDLGDDAPSHRQILSQYSLAYLRFVRSVAAGITLLAYCLWAFEKASALHHSAIYFQLSIVPVAFGVLRYALLLDRGEGGAPEDIVLGDRRLQLAGVLWVALFAVGVYAG